MNWKKGLIIPLIGLSLLACGKQEHILPEKRGQASISTIVVNEQINVPRARLLGVTDGFAGYTFSYGSDSDDESFGYSPFMHYQMPTFLIGDEKVSFLIPNPEPLVPNSIYEFEYQRLLPNNPLMSEELIKVYVDKSFDTLHNYKLSDKLVGIINYIKPIM